MDDVLTWEDDIAVLNHSYHSILLPLYQRRAELEAREEEERKRREADFPLTKEEFATKGRDVGRRAVVFLTTTDTAAKEKMLSEYGWAWRQVRPLMEVFEKDVSFVLVTFRHFSLKVLFCLESVQFGGCSDADFGGYGGEG